MFAKRNNIANYLIYLVAGGAILFFGKALFIPLSFGVLISFIVYPLCKWMELKRIPKMIAAVLCVTIVMVFFLAIIALLLQQIISFSGEWAPLKVKLFESIRSGSVYLSEHFNITKEKQEEWLQSVIENSSTGLLTFLKNLVYASGVSAVLLFIIPIYAVLILYQRRVMVEVLFSLFPPEKRQILNEILIETIHQYYNFVKGMIIVYLIVGTLNSIGLLILGIQHAILFGFIASILTFIPYVGIMAASLLPITVSWLTYDSAWYPFGVIVVFSIVQYLEANVIYPFVVGNRLHLNTLVIIIAIITGGIMWGASGMILFIPFLAILKLIADRTKGLEPLAKILGEKNEDELSREHSQHTAIRDT